MGLDLVTGYALRSTNEPAMDSSIEISSLECPEFAFEGIPEQVRQALLASGEIREFPQGAFIAMPGDPGDRIRFLLAGSASVFLQEQDGPEIRVETIRPGELIGEISYFTGRPTPLNTTVQAEQPCQVLEVPGLAFEKILREHPDYTLSVLRCLARKVMRVDRNVYRVTRKKRALQTLISRQEHLFPDYFVSETVRRRMRHRLEELAASRYHVLITGETGVGKEFMAHALYGMSPHYKRLFLFLDLLRLTKGPEPEGEFCELRSPEPDITNEQMKLFFGQETQTEDGRIVETAGYLELADGATLVVKEIGQLTPPVQQELLKTLKQGTFRRVGGTGSHTTDFRLIGTTNLELSEITPDQHPLLSWLLEHSLVIPPLRERRKEIPTLVQHYVERYCRELHKHVEHIPKETIKSLVSYSWPGNDRELATTLKRAIILCDDGVLRPEHISFDLRRVEGAGKINLLRVPALRVAMRSPLFPAVFQSAAAPFFFILLILLFLGPADPNQNPGGLFSWAVGWPMMVFGSFFWARFWCSLCPIGTLSNLAKKIISLERPFPAFLKARSEWIVALSVLFIIWLESATNIRNSPFNTGFLLITILFLAVMVSIIFERQSWCRYLCPLGGMMGVFAKVSPIELRADRNVCASQCTTNECYLGTSKAPGCPFGQMAPSLRSNRFCKICGNCIKNCPHGAINLNLRIPGSEIWEMKQVGAITAMLVISMFAGLLSELLHKMPVYTRWLSLTGTLPEIVEFTLFFLLVVASANGLVTLASLLSAQVSHETRRENFARYGLALLPLVLTAYMAVHLFYLINLGVYFPIILWQTFQFEIFRQLVITVPLDWTFFLQRILVVLGIVGSVVVSFQLSRGKHRQFRTSLAEFLPHALVATIFGVLFMEALQGLV